MVESEKAIVILKILRDVMNDFSILIENMLKAKEKYGIGYDEIKEVNFSDPNSLKELTKSLPNEKLGMLVGVVAELMGIQTDFQDFVKFDEKQLDNFHRQLKSIVRNFDKVLEE